MSQVRSLLHPFLPEASIMLLNFVPMDIKDVSFVGIVDSNRELLCSYNYDCADTQALLASLDADACPISIYREQTLFAAKLNDITLVLLARPDSNEIFVQGAFDALVECLSRIIKNWCVDRVMEKYDQVVLVLHEFVFKGVVLTDDSEELGRRVMKRTFENVNAIKVNKGLASFLNRATKSLRKQ